MERRGVLIALVLGVLVLSVLSFTAISVQGAISFGGASAINFNPDQGTADLNVQKVDVEKDSQTAPSPAPNKELNDDKNDNDDRSFGEKFNDKIVEPIKNAFDDAVNAIKRGLKLDKPVPVPKESLNGYPNLKHLAESGKDYDLVQEEDGKYYLRDEEGRKTLFEGFGVFEGEKEKLPEIELDKGNAKKESPCGEGICIIHPKQNDTIPASATIVLHILTADKAYCRYSRSEGFAYNDGELFRKDGKDISHNVQLGKLAEGNYTFYYSCDYGNGTLVNATHYFTVGKSADDDKKEEGEFCVLDKQCGEELVCSWVKCEDKEEKDDEDGGDDSDDDEEESNGKCSQGICIISPERDSVLLPESSLIVKISTERKSMCRYGSDADFAFSEGKQFNEGSVERDYDHSFFLYDLAEGDYMLYVKCQDKKGNESRSYISFTIKAPIVIPDNNQTVENETKAIDGDSNESLANYTFEMNGTDGEFNATFNMTIDPETGEKDLRIIIDVPASNESAGESTSPGAPETSSSSGSSGGGGGRSSGGTSSSSQKNVTVVIKKDGEIMAAIPLTVDVQPSLTGRSTAPLPAVDLNLKKGWWIMPLIVLSLISLLPILLVAKNKREDTLVKQLKALIEKSYVALQKGNLTVAMNNYKVLKGYLEMYREKISVADYNRLMSDSSQLYGYIASGHRMAPTH